MTRSAARFAISLSIAAALSLSADGWITANVHGPYAAEPGMAESGMKDAGASTGKSSGGSSLSSESPLSEGKKLFAGKGCGNCHAVTGPEKRLPVTERSRAKGPALWYAGSKFRPGYLAGWLARPKPFRGVRYGTMTKGGIQHPALPPEDAGQVAAYLESLRDAEMPDGIVPRWKKIPRRVLRRARILFQKKQPCYSCHKVKIRKTVYRQPIQLGGFSAPHLIDAGLRLQLDFIAAFLKNPARYNPNGRMPIYGDMAFTRLTEKDFIALAAYISTFKEKP